MATMTLCNAVFMLMLLAALSTCHENAFGAWSGKQRQRKKKLAIYWSWPWISNCWLWDSNSGLSGIEPRALPTRPRRLGANLRRDATSRLLFLNQSVLADFDPRKKIYFQTRSLSGTSNNLVFKTQFCFQKTHFTINNLVFKIQFCFQKTPLIIHNLVFKIQFCRPA